MKSKRLPKMDEEEIFQLIKKQALCRIAFKGDSYPYIAPFQYIVINDILYFHFTDYGKKVDFLKQETPVCIEIERYTQDLGSFAFVTLQGKLKLVEDEKERSMILEKFAIEGKKNFSEKFLSAHGLSLGSKWEDLAGKSFLIVKLDEVVNMTGLKSESYEN